MDQLLGFVVLTGPLFLIVLWVPVCIWLAIWVGRKAIKKNLPLKITGGITVFLLALILPVADVIVDRLYLKHLCEAEAGAKVYQTIELPAEFKNKSGDQILMNSSGVIDYKLLGKLFKWNREDKIYSHVLTNIHKFTSQFVEKEKTIVLAEEISFYSDGGWIEDFSPTPGRGASCRSIDIIKYGEDEYFRQVNIKERDLFSEIFSDLGVGHGNGN